VREDGMKALALVDGPDHVCCRYRIRAFQPALAASGWSLTIGSIASSSIGRLVQWSRAELFDAVILQRKLLPSWQLHFLRQRSKHLIFDFDDAVLYRDSFHPRGPNCRRRAARFARTVRTADTVVAGNDFLADCALRAGARPEKVRVIPTCIATERYLIAEPNDDRAGLTLVWIGSSSTLQGLEQQRPLWERLAREVPGLRLRVISDRFPQLDPMPVEPVTWSEATEAAEIAAADVGIAWMPDDLWSRGKCGLKVLQYQAAGLPVVANPVGVHNEMVEPGASGFLAETPNQWVQAVQNLASDVALRRRMGREARASVQTGYSVQAWAATFVATIAGAAAVPPPKFESIRTGRAKKKKQSTID
ncbi:MAG TPA: glycosyltransferase family 4 protein, partial [Isosphaeraceae bacterium]|nr:glycosyltransferase family 4 protein [Isosphaeraceae bacterium]